MPQSRHSIFQVLKSGTCLVCTSYFQIKEILKNNTKHTHSAIIVKIAQINGCLSAMCSLTKFSVLILMVHFNKINA